MADKASSEREGGVRKPVLVTGTHRSGTTWVGEMLDVSPQLHYVHEPFAPMYERSWIRQPPAERYLHLEPGDISGYEEDLARIVDLDPPWVRIARRAGGIRNAARLAQEAARTTAARRRGARAIIKDPFAMLLAEWLVDLTGAQVVLLIRHPAAFASSVKRLGWRLDVTWLLEQDRLMSGDLSDQADALVAESAKGETDLVDHACVVWSALNSVAARYRDRHPDWNVLRYEDLAMDPVPGFERLYGVLGVPFDEQTGQEIGSLNSQHHGTHVAESSKGTTTRDSRQAIWTWKNRLTSSEIHRVSQSTESVALSWYGEDRWWPA